MLFMVTLQLLKANFSFDVIIGDCSVVGTAFVFDVVWISHVTFVEIPLGHRDRNFVTPEFSCDQ